MNQAQKLLMQIGGTATLVAGHMNHYFADSSTEKKSHKRLYKIDGKLMRGNYGRNIQSKFDALRMEKLKK